MIETWYIDGRFDPASASCSQAWDNADAAVRRWEKLSQRPASQVIRDAAWKAECLRERILRRDMLGALLALTESVPQ